MKYCRLHMSRLHSVLAFKYHTEILMKHGAPQVLFRCITAVATLIQYSKNLFPMFLVHEPMQALPRYFPVQLTFKLVALPDK